nr:dTDP-4-dehydrorhamnose reductase [Corynebacterium lactis]
MTKITPSHSSAADPALGAVGSESNSAGAGLPKVVIVGAAGQLGVALRRSAEAARYDITALTRSQLDIADAEAVATSSALSGASVIINAAAYTDVDGAESDPTAAHLANALGPKYLAARAKAEGSYFIHMSTDYVFGELFHGQEPRPLRADDDTVPVTMYGRTKLVGERNVLDSGARAVIVRTAWVWSGPTQPEARDFVSTMMSLAESGAADGSVVNVVDDQRGNPTFVGDLATGIWQLVDRALDTDASAGKGASGPVEGIVHATGTGSATWFEVAQAVFAAVGEDVGRVRPCTSDEFPRPATRPSWSVLSPESWISAGLSPLPEWESTLARVLS